MVKSEEIYSHNIQEQLPSFHQSWWLDVVAKSSWNYMIEIECIPKMMKKGLLCPLPKPGKDPAIKDCNRGITLLSTLYKLLEKP